MSAKWRDPWRNKGLAQKGMPLEPGSAKNSYNLVKEEE